jgi:alanine racemase
VTGETKVRSVARIDLSAIRHNVGVLARTAAGARMLVVVKANGYGHGAVAVARAAIEAGAAQLGLAAVDEVEELRAAGIDAPMLMWGPLIDDEWRRAAATGCEIAVWSPEGCVSAARAGIRRVHLKLDSGMGRLGARPDAVAELAQAARDSGVEVVGLMTHFATADERAGENAGFMVEQLVRFRAMVAPLRAMFPQAIIHAANSAATLRNPDTHLDMVRCGIAVYGCSPFMDDPADHDLRPAMTLASYLSSVKPILGRESVGYGRKWRAARGSFIGAIPVGYADGYPRAYTNVASVLVGGRRVPVVGMVSMDQITVDLGPEAAERVGDEVVLLGAQGQERLLAEELGRWRDTINYEVTCAVGARFRRVWTP